MLVKTPLYHAWKRGIARPLKQRRLKKIFDCTKLSSKKSKIRILELGCANGMDALQFLTDESKYELYGLDLIDNKIDLPNFKFIKADAAKIPYPDKYFDLVISIGLLEHIEPMEKLSDVIREINRVGKAHASVVPSIATILEPHAVKLFWPFKLHRGFVDKHAKNQKLHLNFFTDHTWTKFEGFKGCDVKRFYYLPPFILNTIIYKSGLND